MDCCEKVYASVEDVQERTSHIFDRKERDIVTALLSDAAAMIDACSPGAAKRQKKIVSCRMVLRALGSDADTIAPIGASQGSMTAGPYTQSWTVSGGAYGELYLSKADRSLLGAGRKIGSYSPVQELAVIPCD